MLWDHGGIYFFIAKKHKIVGFCMRVDFKRRNIIEITDFHVKLNKLNTLAYLQTQKRM
jgi:hypothetical protein